MSVAAAALYDVPSIDGRVLPFREFRWAIRFVANGIGTGLAAVAAAGLLVITVTLAAAWIVNTMVASDPHIHARVAMGPGTLALGQGAPTLASKPDMSFADKWARATASMQIRAVPLMTPQQPVERADNVPAPPPHPAQLARRSPAAAQASAPDISLPVPAKRPSEQANNVPLPRPSPAQREIVLAPAAKPAPQAAPQVASVVPSRLAEKHVATREAHNKASPLPARDSRTAVYDIAAHTVYLPDGERLEAHSGLGDKLDDPRYVKVRMRGPTPPNVYALALREELFHGVRAIRLNPLDDDKMFGRAGMLAHTYMLGPNGQSNGCVSFKDYDKFLHAFLTGKVNRLVVVAHLDGAPRVAHERRGYSERFASNF
jgi:hypothetical protein